MTTTPLRRFWAALVFSVVASHAPANTNGPTVENLGNNTYRVTSTATHKFTRNTAKLQEEAATVASAFCAKEGKQMKVVKVDESRSLYGLGEMARVTLTFKALALTDPEFASAPSPGGDAARAPAVALTNEALYADLLRLDDLRKKGILTDEEFATQKKKVLERSK